MLRSRAVAAKALRIRSSVAMSVGRRALGSMPGDLSDKALFRQQAFVDGKWVDSKSGRKIEVRLANDLPPLTI